MLRLEDLETWIKTNVLPGAVAVYNRRPESPDHLLQINEIPGPPIINCEDVFDNAAVQFFFRSPRADHARARDDAHTVDRALLDRKGKPFYIGGALCIFVDRLGGGPSSWEIDDDNRAVYYGAYYFTLQR